MTNLQVPDKLSEPSSIKQTSEDSIVVRITLDTCNYKSIMVMFNHMIVM